MRLINHPWYFEICQEFHEKFDDKNKIVSELKEERNEVMQKAGNPDDPPNRFHEISYELMEPERELEKYGLISVLMATMFAEAFINDYAAYSLTKSYFKKYLDSLNLISKWVVIPKITVGKNFPTGSQAYEYLKKLISVRNDVVHFKSKEIFGNDDAERYFKENYGPFIEAANLSLQTIQELKKELKKLDPEYFK